MRKIDKLESDVTSKQTTLEQVMNVLYLSAALITNLIYYCILLLGCLSGPVIKWAFGRLRRKTALRGGKTRGSGTEKRCSHKWFHMIFSCTNPCTDTFCTSSALPLKNPQSVANLKKAICVVRSDSIMGVTL